MDASSDADEVSGRLIPCESCGQAVADYRAACPFCGASTGRPERPAPCAAPAIQVATGSRPATTSAASRKKRTVRELAIVVLVVAVVAVVALVVAHVNAGTDASEQALSPEATTFLSRAMPALDHVLAEYQAGGDVQAAHDWSAIGSMPELTLGDFAVGKRYTVYADDVRCYMLEQGCTLQQIEKAKAGTEAAMAAAKAE